MNMLRLIIMGTLFVMLFGGWAQAADKILVYVPWKTENISKATIRCQLYDEQCKGLDYREIKLKNLNVKNMTQEAIIFRGKYVKDVAMISCFLADSSNTSIMTRSTTRFHGKLPVCMKGRSKGGKAACAVDTDCGPEEVCEKGYCWNGDTGKICKSDNDCGQEGNCFCKDSQNKIIEACNYEKKCDVLKCKTRTCYSKAASYDMMNKFFSNLPTTKEPKLGDKCTEKGDCPILAVCDKGFCARDPRNKASGGFYCHNDNQCVSNDCICPNGKEGGGCKNFESGNNKGTCAESEKDKKIKFYMKLQPRRAPYLGKACTRDADCGLGTKLQCADGKFCAPKDGTGVFGDYCHHDNHCIDDCLCPNGHSFFGFCKNYETTKHKGRCM